MNPGTNFQICRKVMTGEKQAFIGSLLNFTGSYVMKKQNTEFCDSRAS